jgi:hypothetical protein
MTFKFRVLLMICLLALFVHTAVSQDQSSNLEIRVLESFDQNSTDRWIARGSKFTTVEYDDAGNVVDAYPMLGEVPGFPATLFGYDAVGQDHKVLGILGRFDRKGHNFIEIIPAKEADAGVPDEEIIYQNLQTGKRYVHDPIVLPGRVTFFDVWVWGSNNDFYLEAHFEDFQGINYAFWMGDLHFLGWRNMRLPIPRSIPQQAHRVTLDTNLKFSKFVLWTEPTENVNQFFLFIDHLKVLTDLFVTRFDGDDLLRDGLLQQVWGSRVE